MNILNWFHTNKRAIISDKEYQDLRPDQKNWFEQTSEEPTHTISDDEDDNLFSDQEAGSGLDLAFDVIGAVADVLGSSGGESGEAAASGPTFDGFGGGNADGAGAGGTF